MCEPGGLCISDIVYQSIEGKAELVFDDLGEQRLKNIESLLSQLVEIQKKE